MFSNGCSQAPDVETKFFSFLKHRQKLYLLLELSNGFSKEFVS